MLYTLVVSIASLSVSGRKIVEIRFAIIDFPDSRRAYAKNVVAQLGKFSGTCRALR